MMQQKINLNCIKKENRHYGEEAFKKKAPKDHNKKQKHAINFRALNPKDIIEVDDYEEDDLNDY